MTFIHYGLFVVGSAFVFVGLRLFQRSFQAVALVKFNRATGFSHFAKNHILAIFIAAIGAGLLGVMFIITSETGDVFFAFAYPLMTMLTCLWFITAIKLKLRKDISDQFHPMITTTIILLIIPIVVFLYLSLEAIAPGLSYPLPTGIPFADANPLVKFYALFILAGALLAYRLSENEFVKIGKKRGYVEDVFLVAFPAGILGARLWYVWGEWATFSQGEFWRIFAVWEGGLAIMGGALGGALAGIAYVLIKRKDIDVIWAIDMAVPTILVAQAIGRWGNFFNQEVYGLAVDVNGWLWLPTFIREQMTITANGITSFRVPLFFIESVINLTGFFVIRYGVGLGLKNIKKPFDMALMYLVWYGLTRGIMEPLRDTNFNMGVDGNWSVFWGWAFFVIGLVAILLNHLLFKVRKKSA